MSKLFCCKHILFFRKAISAVMVLCFSVFSVVGPAGSQTIPISNSGLTAFFQPPVLKGMTVHPENPLLFDFIVDRGQDKINNDLLKDESTKLIKYFLTSMTIPDKDAWVNLSPTEKDRIIPDALGQTEMGRQMLEQDYVLKQLAASLTNPDTELGKKYWDEVKKRKISTGARSIVPLQNKVWIVPDGATVVEKDGFAYITESKLKVMLDEDRSLDGQRSVEIDAGAPSMAEKNLTPPSPLFKKEGGSISTQVFREMILPKLVEEVNAGKNFAATRQVYQSVILAAWYKRALKDSLLGKIYADKSKIAGVETDVKDIKQKVYEQYLEAFKKGAYNVIKEEPDLDGETIPRKYFSGGEIMASAPTVVSTPAAVRGVEVAISGLGDQLALVAASGVESPDERQAIASAAVRKSDEPDNPARRGFLKTGAAALAALAFWPHAKAADIFVAQNTDIGGVSKQQDTFEKIMEEILGKEVLNKLAPAKRKEILEKAFEIFKQENPNIQFEAIDKPFAPGTKFLSKDTHNYLNFSIYMALSNLVTQDTVELPGKNIPLYYAQPKIAAGYIGMTSAMAFGKYGIIIDINTVHADIVKGREILLKSRSNLDAPAHYLTDLLEGKSDREVLENIFVDLLTHEFVHIAMGADLDLPIRSTEPWITALLAKPDGPMARQEVWAYLIHIAKSKMPRITMNTLRAHNFMSNHLTLPTVIASRIVVWSILDQLEFGQYLKDEEIEMGHPRGKDISSLEKLFYYSWRKDEWLNKENPSVIEDLIESMDQFLATKTTQEINDAALAVFKRLSGGKSIPQIPTDIKVPEEVFKVILGAASSTLDNPEVSSSTVTASFKTVFRGEGYGFYEQEGEEGVLYFIADKGSPENTTTAKLEGILRLLSFEEINSLKFIESGTIKKPFDFRMSLEGIVDDLKGFLSGAYKSGQQESSFFSKLTFYIRQYPSYFGEQLKGFYRSSDFVGLILESSKSEPIVNLKSIKAAALSIKYTLLGLNRALPYIKFEVLPGGQVMSKSSLWRSLSLDEKLDVLIDLADTFQKMHEAGIVYNNVSAQSILVGQKDGKPAAMPFDFTQSYLYVYEMRNGQSAQAAMRADIMELARMINFEIGTQVPFYEASLDPTIEELINMAIDIYYTQKNVPTDMAEFVDWLREIKEDSHRVKNEYANLENRLSKDRGSSSASSAVDVARYFASIMVGSFIFSQAAGSDISERILQDPDFLSAVQESVKSHAKLKESQPDSKVVIRGHWHLTPNAAKEMDDISESWSNEKDDANKEQKRQQFVQTLDKFLADNQHVLQSYNRDIEWIKEVETRGIKKIGIEQSQDWVDQFKNPEDISRLRNKSAVVTSLFKAAGVKDPVEKAEQYVLLRAGPVLYKLIKGDISFDLVIGFDNEELKLKAADFNDKYLDLFKRLSENSRFRDGEYPFLKRFIDQMIAATDPVDMNDLELLLTRTGDKSPVYSLVKDLANIYNLRLEHWKRRDEFMVNEIVKQKKDGIIVIVGGLHSDLFANLLWQKHSVLSNVIPDELDPPNKVSEQQKISVAPGGIDFDPSKLNLQIKRDGKGVPLPLPQQDLENINIRGLYPVILNILPVNAQTLPILGQLQASPDVVLSKG